MAAIPLNDDYQVRRVPVGTFLLIAANVAVYLASPMSMMAVWNDADLMQRACEIEAYHMQWGAIPVELLTGRPLDDPVSCESAAEFSKVPWISAMTAQFLHSDAWHLLGNMVFLFVFGPAVEDRLGTVRYVLFYMLCGLAAVYGFAMGLPESQMPLVGASGAISGVLGAYLVVQFRSRVVSLLFGFIPVRLPGWAIVATYFVIDYVHFVGRDLLPGSSTTNVAYGAHVYGFVAGVVGGLLIYRIRWRGGVRIDTR